MNEVDKPKSAQEQFQEKLAEKIRKDIGDLMPDEALAEMVSKTAQKIFFERPRVNEGSSYNPRWVEKPGWFENVVQETMEATVQEHIQSWLTDNSHEIMKMVREAIEKDGMKLLTTLLAHAIVGNTRQGVMNLESKLFETRSDLYNRNLLTNL